MKKILLLLTMGLCLSTAVAEEPTTEPSEERPEVSEGNIPQDEVIIQSDGATRIEEYRENGRVTKVKVTPKKGRPYYLVDSDGDGSLDQIQWILVTW